MTTITDPRPVLVTGATGKTGRRVADRLAARGVAVRAGSRAGTPRFDWHDPSSWPAALDGVGAAYLAYAPDLVVPGAVDVIRAFTEAATAAGVDRFVLLAGRGEAEATAAADAVRASGGASTVILASWFDQNFTEGQFLPMVLEGQLVVPAGDTVEPFVDVDDIADVAVAALTDDRHLGRTYDVTGPRLLSFADVASEITAATGRSIEHLDVSAADFRAGAIAAGVPEDEADMITGLFVELFDGRNAHVGSGVEEALGRPATDFSDFARRAAALGAWDVPAELAS